jgi:hypothetical protein
MSDFIRRGVQVRTFTPVVTAASAYAANNVVGTLFEIPNAIVEGGASALVKSITGLSKAKSDASLTLVLFSSQPAGTFTDKTAFNPSNADLARIAAVVPFGGTWKDFATGSASTDKALDTLVQSAPSPQFSTSFWGILVAVGTPTFSTTSDLTVKIALEQY